MMRSFTGNQSNALNAQKIINSVSFGTGKNQKKIANGSIINGRI